jgi:hypothetical protein
MSPQAFRPVHTAVVAKHSALGKFILHLVYAIVMMHTGLFHGIHVVHGSDHCPNQGGENQWPILTYSRDLH